jgi:drug/metabolite transporter (DMT)-like permease
MKTAAAIPTQQATWLPMVLLCLLALIWGSSFILMKRSLLAFSPTQVAAGRIVFSFLVLLPFAFKKAAPISRTEWKYVALMGLIGNLIPAFLFAIAITELKSSVTGILNALTPLFTLLVGVAAFSVKMNKKQLVGLLLAFGGSIALSFINAEGGLGSFNSWALLVVLATVCYGTSTNIIKNFLGAIPPLKLAALALLFTGVPSLLYLLAFSDFNSAYAAPKFNEALIALFILGTIGTGLGLALFNKLVQLSSAVFASSVTYVIPLVAVGWGLADGEQLFGLHFAGMALIIAGIFIINRNK